MLKLDGQLRCLDHLAKSFDEEEVNTLCIYIETKVYLSIGLPIVKKESETSTVVGSAKKIQLHGAEYNEYEYTNSGRTV